MVDSARDRFLIVYDADIVQQRKEAALAAISDLQKAIDSCPHCVSCRDQIMKLLAAANGLEPQH